MTTYSWDGNGFADEVRHALGYPPDRPIHISRRCLPDSVACALACNQDDELVILIDEDKPLAGDQALQLLVEITFLHDHLLAG